MLDWGNLWMGFLLWEQKVREYYFNGDRMYNNEYNK